MGRVSAGSVGVVRPVAAALAGGVGRVLSVACALACVLMLSDAVLGGLEWVFTRDRRASEDAARSLVAGTALLALTVEGVYAREKLRRALERRGADARANPWAAD